MRGGRDYDNALGPLLEGAGTGLPVTGGVSLPKKLGVKVSEKSLPLEGGAPHSESKIYMTASGSHTSTMVVRPKPDRMRSKVAILYQLMAMICSFDLISRN